LVAAAIEWLSDREAERVFAWVADDNPRALAFYRNAGFVATREIQPLPSDPSKLETLFCVSAHGG
jgi:ribosomal protein S18 acetylase RimI-like enzyme